MQSSYLLPPEYLQSLLSVVPLGQQQLNSMDGHLSKRLFHLYICLLPDNPRLHQQYIVLLLLLTLFLEHLCSAELSVFAVSLPADLPFWQRFVST